MSESYRRAGVDLDAAKRSVDMLRDIAARTFRPGVLGELGGFGGLFSLGDAGLSTSPHSPDDTFVLVSGADGVGTKLDVASRLGRHDTIGIDCVAMCVNDIMMMGARPLFFLDYISTGKLEPARIATIVEGIAQGCIEAGCALLGGETAEMPRFYLDDRYDLAGFCVGGVWTSKMYRPKECIEQGDILIAFGSSGAHCNGYALIRDILEREHIALNATLSSVSTTQTIGEMLLRPTRIYREGLEALEEVASIKGGSHITGGGMMENIPRMLPSTSSARIELTSWKLPSLFTWLVERGSLSQTEAYRVFNMGVGCVVAVHQSRAEMEKICRDLSERLGYDVWVIGCIEERTPDVPAIRLI